MPPTLDWPPPRPPRRAGRLFLLAVLAVVALGGGTALGYYVDALWYGSLGFSDVFWTRLNLEALVFVAFAAATFAVLSIAYRVLKPPHLGEIAGGTIRINGQPVRLPVEPVLDMFALGLSTLLALAVGAGMMARWSTLALYWYAPGPAGAAAGAADPIFSRPLAFYLFTLPAWQMLTGWLLTLAVVVCGIALFFVVITGGGHVLMRRGPSRDTPLRGFSVAVGGLMAVMAARVYLARFERLFADHTIFSGVTYTDAHVMIPGMLVVSIALLLGAAAALVNAAVSPRLRWLVAAAAPPAGSLAVVGLLGWYVGTFVVKPNELVRERPYITHNIELTRQAYGLDQLEAEAFPAAQGVEAADAANNQETLRSIRLWDWRALQDTLRQIQAIRTYYDFLDIDIDRYAIDGRVTQMMVAARELNVAKLPESSRNWINEKLIYTHGYGVTMNPVNGFTPEGMPDLILSNMPVESRAPGIAIARPEIYFGEATDTDVYVNTRQEEFDYPQGDANRVSSYEGTGGILVGGFLRRLLIAADRGDLMKLPFSDDVSASSRLLMRRNIRARAAAIAPFLLFDDDPYIVVGDDGRLRWMMDAFTTSSSYPYARHIAAEGARFNYLRNSVKVVVDAYDGTVSFYVFDPADPVLAAYRRLFPTLFKDRAEMPPDLLRHVRYPELMISVQAAVYGLYHMTNPDMFYNREDLWSIASEIATGSGQQQAEITMEPNFVLMKLPGESSVEFVEILPFTPANRNNLIGWIAGRSDGEHYGRAVVYEFPKTRLVDGPLQIEARIDQNAQLSAQMSLWDQQGSSVRRGNLIVIPVGRALLYAEPIYLQAERSPMPELRIVVLALQDRLAYGSTFEAALASLFGGQPSTLESAAVPAAPSPAAAAAPVSSGGAPAPAPAAADREALIEQAARDLADYQQLTAEGRLGEAGARLESLKRTLEQLQRR
ncbi:MAG: UPF0182 family protein [Acidobacteria bacterium]|nr:UPF0182 family protein [Acidobacteriota bacterium]